MNLAYAYAKIGQTDQAIRELENANLLSYSRNETRTEATARFMAGGNIGMILFKKAQLGNGKIDRRMMLQAHDVLGRVWNEHKFPGAAIYLAAIYLQFGQREDALKIVNAGIAKLPEYPWFGYWSSDLYVAKFDVLRALGDCAGALESFKIAKSQDADLTETPSCP